MFLDEIGELPLDLQTNFLHVLEERSVRRIGSNRQIPLDVRVITATHRDLRAAVNQGSFRADLYYRLNTISVEVPPLRQRREDIPLLVEHFFKELGAGAPPPELVAAFQTCDWPGNIRELKNAVERAVVLADVGAWQALTENAPAEASFGEGTSPGDGSFSSAKEFAIARWETWYLSNLMKLHDGNLTKAARHCHMDRKYLRSLLKKRGLRS